jgi:hypothetical protein
MIKRQMVLKFNKISFGIRPESDTLVLTKRKIGV